MSIRSNRRALHIAYPHSRGLTLVEIMVALLVLSIGILGLASLQTASLSFSAAAYQRTQATVLAYDMADRMRSNRQAAMNNLYNIGFENPVPACGAPNLAGTVPEQDISAWRMALACRLPQSTGSITRNGNEFTLTVLWDDSQGREAPLSFQFTTAL